MELEVLISQSDLAVNTRVETQISNYSTFIYANEGVVAVITEQGRYLLPPKQAIWVAGKTPFQIIATTQAQLSYFSIKSTKENIPVETTKLLRVTEFLNNVILEAISLHQHADKPQSYLLILQIILERIVEAENIGLLLPAVKDQRLIAITSRQQKFPALKTDLVGWGKFVHASPRTLSRVFKKETGLTYSEWKQMLAIHIAIIELYLGESIAMIAKNLGYESSSAFIFMFKKQMKVTPSYFLNSLVT